jgi:hypothetical protein
MQGTPSGEITDSQFRPAMISRSMTICGPTIEEARPTKSALQPFELKG